MSEPPAEDRPLVSLDELIAAADRELVQRKRVYRRWVDAGKMSHAKAQHELRCMRDIGVVLRRLKAAERLI